MKLLPLVITINTALVTASSAQQLDSEYVNQEQKERAERIIAPFKAGEIAPMQPSNYQAPQSCTWPEELAKWEQQDKAWRRDGDASDINREAGTSIDVYYFERLLSVLETRDCSCAAQVVDPSHAIELTYMLPISDLLGVRAPAGKFYLRYNLRTLAPLARTYCGGDI